MSTGGGRPYHWLFIGSSGSGKTHTLRTFLRAYVCKPRYLVIVNSTSELSEFARKRVVVDNAALEKGATMRELYTLIKTWGAVHFEVTAGKDELVRAYMDALGRAVRALGHIVSMRCRVLLAFDECQNYLSEAVFSDGMRIVYTEGRKFGIHTMAGTQSFGGTGKNIISMHVKKAISVIVCCGIDEPNERARVLSTYPELPDPAALQFPDKATQTPGEYAIRDRIQRRGVRVVVKDRRRFARWFLGAPSTRRRRHQVRGGQSPPQPTRSNRT